MATYEKAEVISLVKNPEFNEAWVEEIIQNDPGLLDLGELELRDRQRIQPDGRRIDLLFGHVEENKRYVVEIQLGQLDESHIIRTVNYWDIESRRWPGYDHYAVVIAEDSTKHLNVLNIIGQSVPLIVYNMTAIRLAGKVSLTFTKVFTSVERGLEEEDEPQATDRNFWESSPGRGRKASLALTDELLKVVNDVQPGNALKFNKHYVGIMRNGRSNLWVLFRPKRQWVKVEVRLAQLPSNTLAVDATGLTTLAYDSPWRRYRLVVSEGDLDKSREQLKALFQLAVAEAGKD
jgi:hypothetical protein